MSLGVINHGMSLSVLYLPFLYWSYLPFLYWSYLPFFILELSPFLYWSYLPFLYWSYLPFCGVISLLYIGVISFFYIGVISLFYIGVISLFLYWSYSTESDIPWSITVIVVMSRRVMGIKILTSCRWSGGNKTPGVNLVIKCVVLQVN